MKVIAIQSSPNKNGLTRALAVGVLRGAQKAGAETEVIDLNDLKILPCQVCNLGWGSCKARGQCDQKDDFDYLREAVNGADALVFATPVYFGDISETAKLFLDRWRRCEVYDREHSPLIGKRAIGIAAAGGSGAGAVNALNYLEKYLQWLQFTIWDLAAVTQTNKLWTLKALEAAGCNMVETQEPAKPRKRARR